MVPYEHLFNLPSEEPLFLMKFIYEGGYFKSAQGGRIFLKFEPINEKKHESLTLGFGKQLHRGGSEN